MRNTVLALLLVILAVGCSSPSGGTSSGGKAGQNAAAAGPGKIDTGPRIADERVIKAGDLTSAEIAQFRMAWNQFVTHQPIWRFSRDEWLAKGGAAPYVLSENLFRYFWSASLVRKEDEIDRVGENAAVIGEPAVAYFAKCLVLDKWPLKGGAFTTEITDPDDLDGKIKKTFSHFEMDDETRRFAARVLAAIGEPAVPTLSSDAVLKQARPTSKRYAAYALGRIGSPAAVVRLQEMMRTDPGWAERAAAATALGEALRNGADTRVALEQAANSDSDAFVRRKAREALLGLDPLKF